MENNNFSHLTDNPVMSSRHIASCQKSSLLIHSDKCERCADKCSCRVKMDDGFTQEFWHSTTCGNFGVNGIVKIKTRFPLIVIFITATVVGRNCKTTTYFCLFSYNSLLICSIQWTTDQLLVSLGISVITLYFFCQMALVKGSLLPRSLVQEVFNHHGNSNKVV